MRTVKQAINRLRRIGGPVCSVVAAITLSGSVAVGAQDASRERAAVLMVPAMEAALTAGATADGGPADYASLIEAHFGVRIDILVDDWYDAEPAAIRARLAAEYARGGEGDDLPLVGAILVGPIPAAQMGKPVRPNAVSPRPLYYEDFDAEWFDDDGDGRFDRCVTDRATNATEIWAAWWVPPSNDPDEQVALLKAFIAKLNRYHRGELGSGDADRDSSGLHGDVLPGSSRVIRDSHQYRASSTTARPLPVLCEREFRWGTEY